MMITWSAGELYRLRPRSPRLESHAPAACEITPRESHGVAVDLGFGDHQITVLWIGLRVDAHRVART